MMESDWIWILLSCKTWITIISVYIFPHQKQAYLWHKTHQIHHTCSNYSLFHRAWSTPRAWQSYRLCRECGDPLALERWTLAIGCRLCGNYIDLATGAQQKQQGKPQQAVYLPYESVNVKTNTAHSTTRGWAWSRRKRRGKNEGKKSKSESNRTVSIGIWMSGKEEGGERRKNREEEEEGEYEVFNM